jgi:hypothetical protein
MEPEDLVEAALMGLDRGQQAEFRNATHSE